MSVSEFERLEKELKPLVKFLGMVRVMVAASIATVVFVISGSLWVFNQTSAIASHSKEIQAINEDRKQVVREWMEWRRIKDEADTKLITLLENQQRLLESHQRWIERQ
jgi:hypothetical protein